MLTQYENIDDILNATGSMTGQRIASRVIQNLQYAVPQVSWDSEIGSTGNNVIELHVYANDTWITGNHRMLNKNIDINALKDPISNQPIKFDYSPVKLDLYNALSKLKINAGKFNFAINFHKNLIGSYEKQYLAIDQISEDRTELRLLFTDPSAATFKHELQVFIQTVANGYQTALKTGNTPNKYKSYLLNFSRNQTVVFVNSVVYNNHLYVKLLKPLPEEFDTLFKCWVVEEQKPTFIDRVSVLPYIKTKSTYRDLSSPNWYANSNLNTSVETDFKTWTDLLGPGIQTSEQIINAYFSGSLGTNLNIDFSDFNNFIFYSSAEERVKNFKYKLELLNYYDNQISNISVVPGNIASTNVIEYTTLKNNLIGGFDGFEKHLYYESSSKLTTHDIPLENPTVANLTGSYITPLPKQNSIIPYINYSVTSSQFTSWYTGLLDSASLYDSMNFNALRYAIPEFVRINKQDSGLDLFINMLGHHYDILYTYINHMTKIHKREENPKLGMPNELLYSVAKQFGWNLTNGNQYQELWSYLFGSDEYGIPLTGSLSVNGTSLSGQTMTHTVWRRIVNNLPLLLKSKGTKRSINALLSCYGIPNSIITINEYGGPRIDRAPVYEKVNFDYALDLINNTAGSVNINYSHSLNAVELRFRTDNVVTNPLVPSTMTLYTVGSNAVTIDYTSGTLGTIRINGTASADIEMFDGGWLNTVLRTSGNKLEIVAKRAKYGKIVSAVSASATASFIASGSVILGGTSAGSVRLQGQLQEFRLWSSSLNDSAFNNHVKAPGAYNGNTDAYDELLFRLPLTQKINHASTSSLTGAQPMTMLTSASFSGWSNAEPYDSIEETYYYDAISLGAGSFDDNKVRIEENELIQNLDVKQRAERSQYDKAPLDSNKLGIYFSPQTMINEDIISQLGFISLDDYIGDPGETDKKSYPKLIDKAHDYWKKYSSKNDINSYIKMFTLFDLSFFRQLEQLLPARAHAVTGLLIQPNILERSKDSALPDLQKLDLTYEGIIYDTQPDANALYPVYTGTINDSKLGIITATDDDQLTAYLTASNDSKYSGTKYKRTYLYRTGSTYMTGSTPYWQSEGVLPVITGSSKSEYKRFKKNSTYSYFGSTYGSAIYGTSVYAISVGSIQTGSISDTQDYLPYGLNNLWFAGCKLVSRDFNIGSTDTVDGGPVVEWRLANGNQLIYQSVNQDGAFKLSGNQSVTPNDAPANGNQPTI